MDYSRIPFINKIYSSIKNKFSLLESEIADLSKENIQLRLKIKKTANEKINVLFICHRPSIWVALKTVYEAMKTDDRFCVTIVVIPNKKQLPKFGLNHAVYESEGAESFWKGKDVIQGYNYESQTWLNVKQLNPDYVFLQQPYNITKPDFLNSKIISRYAKLCYVPYFTFLPNKINNTVNDECNPMDFLDDLSFYFTQSKAHFEYVSKRYDSINSKFTKIVLTGDPYFDNLSEINKDESNWNFPDKKEYFRLIWTPRWCTNEGNCSFFDYKDKLIDYCINNKDIDFIFRPHPQAFANWNATGELPEAQAAKYKEIYDTNENIKIDTRKDYLGTFYTSNCIISDISSIIPEYFLTGKPIIYCDKKGSINTFVKDKGYAAGFYWVQNWEDLEKTLDMLRSGKDPLREKRQELIKSEFYIPEKGAGYSIKEAIKNDFLNA
jgi:hypothetical protein